jgi:hypothetical protein
MLNTPNKCSVPLWSCSGNRTLASLFTKQFSICFRIPCRRTKRLFTLLRRIQHHKCWSLWLGLDDSFPTTLALRKSQSNTDRWRPVQLVWNRHESAMVSWESWILTGVCLVQTILLYQCIGLHRNQTWDTRGGVWRVGLDLWVTNSRELFFSFGVFIIRTFWRN